MTKTNGVGRPFGIGIPVPTASFLYAVSSTGIYCRPTCPSRRPRRENVAFYDGTAAARAAGYRACKRCRPDEVSRHQQVVAQVKKLLMAEGREPTLAALGEAVGLSPYHLQRVFKQATGLSPKQYAIAQREERLKGHLRDGKDVTTAMYDAGYESSHALYRKGARHLGMSPRAYRRGGAGVKIRYSVFDGSLGPCLGHYLVAATDRGIVSLRFGSPPALVEELRRDFPSAELTEDAEALREHQHIVESYLEGGRRSLALPLDLYPTEFQERVWRALEEIPPGETRSYGEIAEAIGRPTAARAVARACATNPVALVIPCHRVIGADGRLGGYRWGIERKRALLEAEGAVAG